MPKLKLTERMAESLRPAERRELRVFDEHTKNLVLSVSYGGQKSWFALYYVDGKPRYAKLGEYQPVAVILDRCPGQPTEARADHVKAALLAASKCEPAIGARLSAVLSGAILRCGIARGEAATQCSNSKPVDLMNDH